MSLLFSDDRFRFSWNKQDRDCVDTILTLESDKLAFAKRALRVQRCKVLTSENKGPKSASKSVTKASKPAHSEALPSTTTIPKGNPLLGARLAGLSKDERKAAKARDAERVARRLAKKKARGAMQAGEPGAGTKVTRKRVRDKKAVKVNPGRKEGKRRIRSDRSVQRRNVKK